MNDGLNAHAPSEAKHTSPVSAVCECPSVYVARSDMEDSRSTPIASRSQRCKVKWSDEETYGCMCIGRNVGVGVGVGVGGLGFATHNCNAKKACKQSFSLAHV